MSPALKMGFELLRPWGTISSVGYVHFGPQLSSLELQLSRKTCVGSRMRFYSQDLSCSSTFYLDEAVLTPKSA